eukprot:7743_1
MNSVPLTDVLPWGDDAPSGGRTILVFDSAEADGRFLCHEIVSQCLSFNKGAKTLKGDPVIKSKARNIIWLHCGTVTKNQIRAAMKRKGCDLRSNQDMVDIIMIIPNLIDSNEKNIGEYLKNIYYQVKQKVDKYAECLIIIDDATSLSIFFRSTTILSFFQKIKALVRTRANLDDGYDSGLVIIASQDLNQEQYFREVTQEQTTVTSGEKFNYIGAEQALKNDAPLKSEEICWEMALTELADGIVDVVPLASGFARDVHGRLIFTERLTGGLGWKETGYNESKSTGGFSTCIVNYCCSDAGVRAIRLRVGS